MSSSSFNYRNYLSVAPAAAAAGATAGSAATAAVVIIATGGSVEGRVIQRYPTALLLRPTTTEQQQKPRADGLVSVALAGGSGVPPLYSLVRFGDAGQMESCVALPPGTLCELIPHPIPQGLRSAPPLLLYVPEGVEHLYEQSPGLHLHNVHRDSKEWAWTNKHTGVEARRLTITCTVTQWHTQQQLASRSATHIPCKIVLWDDKCRALPGDGLTPDMDAWKLLMAVHPIPFTVAVCTDTTNTQYASRIFTDLHVTSVRWEMRTYLTTSQRVLALTEADATKLMPLTKPKETVTPATTDHEEVLNVSVRQAMPPAAGAGAGARRAWRYYALSSAPDALRSATDLHAALKTKKAVAVILAMQEATPAAAPATATPVLSQQQDDDDDDDGIFAPGADDDGDDDVVEQEVKVEEEEESPPSRKKTRKSKK